MASTKTTTAKQPRQSREGQRQQRITAAYKTIREVGAHHGNPTMEDLSVASQSNPDAQYVVTHDLVTDRYHCECMAGIHSRVCVHVEAAKRYVAARRTRIQAQQAADTARDTAPLRRDNRPFSQRFMA